MRLSYLQHQFIASIFVLSLFFIFTAGSCRKDEPMQLKYAICNQMLAEPCSTMIDGEYCTFGFKWGSDNPFIPSGIEVPGPASPVTSISYRFVKGGVLFDTHAQENLRSISFDDAMPCLRDSIRKAFQAWADVSSLSFVEMDAEADTDIRVVQANSRQSGIGYPAFDEGICTDLAGLIVIQENDFDCDRLYKLALHEIGHTLGLGHIRSNNIMNPNSAGLFALGDGDIAGIQSIYQ